MVKVTLTQGQLQILLNGTSDPATRQLSPITQLVSCLHKAQVTGHKWRTEMTDQEIGAALDILTQHQQTARSPGAQQALRIFIRDHPTAKRIFDERQAKFDVPRETSEEA
jgi:hypothetical protein